MTHISMGSPEGFCQVGLVVIGFAFGLGNRRTDKIKTKKILCLFPWPKWPDDKTSGHTCTSQGIAVQRQPGGSDKAEIPHFGDTHCGDASWWPGLLRSGSRSVVWADTCQSRR